MQIEIWEVKVSTCSFASTFLYQVKILLLSKFDAISK